MPDHHFADAVIIGGGPAGLRAAEVLAAAGRKVALCDQKLSVGRKFLVAGKGGLNLTHSEPLESFAARYEDEPARWRGLLAAFGPAELRAWAENLGVETYVGTSGRVFPRGQQAAALLRRWVARLRALGVSFHVSHRLEGLQANAAAGWRLDFRETRTGELRSAKRGARRDPRTGRRVLAANRFGRDVAGHPAFARCSRCRLAARKLRVRGRLGPARPRCRRRLAAQERRGDRPNPHRPRRIAHHPVRFGGRRVVPTRASAARDGSSRHPDRLQARRERGSALFPPSRRKKGRELGRNRARLAARRGGPRPVGISGLRPSNGPSRAWRAESKISPWPCGVRARSPKRFLPLAASPGPP